MKAYIKNIITSLIALLVIIILNFFLPRMLNGNPLHFLAGIEGDINGEVIEELTKKYGLDRPVFEQFGLYLKNILAFDLGFSYQSNLNVRDLVFTRITATLEISIISIILSSVLAYFIGSYAGYTRKNKLFDKTFSKLSIFLVSLPSFVFALAFVYLFSYKLRIFPTSGLQSLIVPDNFFLRFLDRCWHLVLPIFTLTVVTFPSNFFLVRNLVKEEREKKYVAYLESRGLSYNTIVHKNIFHNIKASLFVQIGLRFSFVLGGALVIENIFSIKGVGTLLESSVRTLDYPVIQGALLVSSTFAVVINIIIDIVSMLIDPQVRRKTHA